MIVDRYVCVCCCQEEEAEESERKESQGETWVGHLYCAVSVWAPQRLSPSNKLERVKSVRSGDVELWESKEKAASGRVGPCWELELKLNFVTPY